MKKITLLLASLATTISALNAQTLISDFSTTATMIPSAEASIVTDPDDATNTVGLLTTIANTFNNYTFTGGETATYATGPENYNVVTMRIKSNATEAFILTLKAGGGTIPEYDVLVPASSDWVTIGFNLSNGIKFNADAPYTLNPVATGSNNTFAFGVNVRSKVGYLTGGDGDDAPPTINGDYEDATGLLQSPSLQFPNPAAGVLIYIDDITLDNLTQAETDTLSSEDFNTTDVSNIVTSANPVASTIELNAEGSYSIVDLGGATKREGTFSESINVESLNAGVYFLAIEGGVYKFVKE